MNASLSTLLTAIAAVAAAAVLGLGLAEQSNDAALASAATAAPGVTTAQRAPVEQLPPVVIEVRRMDGLALAQADAPQPR